MSQWRLVALNGKATDALLRRPELLVVLQRAPGQPGYELGLGQEPELAYQRWGTIDRARDSFTAAARWMSVSCDALRMQRPEDTAIIDLLDLERPAVGDLAGPPRQRLLSARTLRRLAGVLRYAHIADWLAVLAVHAPEDPAEAHKKRLAELRRRLERAVVMDQGLWMAAGA